MNKYSLADGFHPIDKEDLGNLLPKIKGAAVSVWLAYLRLPARELELNSSVPYLSALSAITNQQIMDLTGLSEPAITAGREKLCEVGELEKMSRGVYKITHYKKLKIIGDDRKIVGQTQESLPTNIGDDRKKDGQTQNSLPRNIGDHQKIFGSNQKIFGMENGDSTNGHQALQRNLGVSKKRKEVYNDNISISDLEIDIKQRFPENAERADQYLKWLNMGMNGQGFSLAKMINDAGGGYGYNWNRARDAAQMERLKSEPLLHVLDGLWSAIENSRRGEDLLPWITKHVDRYDFYHKDDPDVLNAKLRKSEDIRDRKINIRDLLDKDYLATTQNKETFDALAELPLKVVARLIEQARSEGLKNDALMRRLDELLAGEDSNEE